jgi:hypothetical protein
VTKMISYAGLGTSLESLGDYSLFRNMAWRSQTVSQRHYSDTATGEWMACVLDGVRVAGVSNNQYNSIERLRVSINQNIFTACSDIVKE